MRRRRFRQPATHCILFCAHYLTDIILAEFRQLQSAAQRLGYKAVLLYDNSRNDFVSGDLATDEYALFTRDEIARRFDMYSCSPEGRIYDGNTSFPILWFAHKHRYDYYWRIEYDVRYGGDWLAFFAAFETNTADLLTTTLTYYEDRPDWKWWSTFRTPWHRFWPVRRIRAFLPVCRLSRRACNKLSRCFRRGWAGHDEVSVPTIVLAKRLVVEDIGGTGPFVKAGNENRFYTNTPNGQYLVPGTFVCPPGTSTVKPDSGKLFHPVK